MSLLLSLPGLEPRTNRLQAAMHATTPTLENQPASAFTTARSLLQSHPQLRAFLAFMFLSIMGIFLQDAILEVFGKEVFDLTVAETTRFTQLWGGWRTTGHDHHCRA